MRRFQVFFSQQVELSAERLPIEILEATERHLGTICPLHLIQIGIHYILHDNPKLLSQAAKFYGLGLRRMQKDCAAYTRLVKNIDFIGIISKLGPGCMPPRMSGKIQRAWKRATKAAQARVESLDRENAYGYDPRWIIFAYTLLTTTSPVPEKTHDKRIRKMIGMQRIFIASGAEQHARSQMEAQHPST